jgi:hypothetical protein
MPVGGDGDAVSFWFAVEWARGELQREPSVRNDDEGDVLGATDDGGLLWRERIWPVRHAWQRVGVVLRLVRQRYYANSPVDDPTGPTSGSHRVTAAAAGSTTRGLPVGAVPERMHAGPGDFSLGFRLASSSVDQSGR